MIISLTIISYSFLFKQITSAQPMEKNYGESSSNYYLNNDSNSNNNNRSIFPDKQLLASKQNITTTVVLIVENASNPTNKIFYDPSPITIKKGSSITWINKDPTIHTVTSGKTDNDSTQYKFNSGMLIFNSTYIHKFDNIGIYYYHCFIHPFMIGKINVVS